MGRIVVGVDGSAPSLAALRWALAEAGLRGMPVLAVHAYHSPMFGMDQVPTPSPILDLAPSARALVEEQLRRAHADPRVPVEILVAEGGAARLLVEVALPDDLLVVGSRGHGGFAGMLLGSTSHQVTAHACCPVVVAR